MDLFLNNLWNTVIVIDTILVHSVFDTHALNNRGEIDIDICTTAASGGSLEFLQRSLSLDGIATVVVSNEGWGGPCVLIFTVTVINIINTAESFVHIFLSFFLRENTVDDIGNMRNGKRNLVSLVRDKNEVIFLGLGKCRFSCIRTNFLLHNYIGSISSGGMNHDQLLVLVQRRFLRLGK